MHCKLLQIGYFRTETRQIFSEHSRSLYRLFPKEYYKFKKLRPCSTPIVYEAAQLLKEARNVPNLKWEQPSNILAVDTKRSSGMTDEKLSQAPKSV